MRPDKIAYVENFKAYKNTKGVFLHLSRNIHFLGGLFADNREGLEVDRSDNIDVWDATFIGISESFQSLMARQGITKTCRWNQIVGLEHHTWKNEIKNEGSKMTNLTFNGFVESGCAKAHAIRVDDRVSTHCSCLDSFTSKASTISLIFSLFSSIFINIFRFKLAGLICTPHLSNYILKRELRRSPSVMQMLLILLHFSQIWMEV